MTDAEINALEAEAEDQGLFKLWKHAMAEGTARYRMALGLLAAPWVFVPVGLLVIGLLFWLDPSHLWPVSLPSEVMAAFMYLTAIGPSGYMMVVGLLATGRYSEPKKMWWKKSRAYVLGSAIALLVMLLVAVGFDYATRSEERFMTLAEFFWPMIVYGVPIQLLVIWLARPVSTQRVEQEISRT